MSLSSIRRMSRVAVITFFIILIQFAYVSSSIPFIVIHGLNSACSHQNTRNFTQQLIDYSGSPGYCIEVGDGVISSWFMPMKKQVEFVCDKVKNMPELKDGYNIVGLSQGNLISRGVIELCNGGPPVRNYVSLAGPHAGLAAPILCGSRAFCVVADGLIKTAVYTKFVQDTLAVSGYLKLPENMEGYFNGCKFLPMLNNEIPGRRNPIYKSRFTSLENLVLIMFEDDKVIVPKESSWFGFYPDGKFEPVLHPNETKLYTEDWIGLKTLTESGRVKYITVGGAHIDLSFNDMLIYVVPYLKA